MASTTSIISGLSHHYVRKSNSSLHDISSQDSQKSPRTSTRLECKPRMVINKMILNNFKSYFGEQEIGPFHKAWYSFLTKSSSAPCYSFSDIYIYIYLFNSHFPLLSDQMVQGNQMLLMLFYLYLDIEQTKWDKQDYQNLFIHHRGVKIWILVLLKYILKKLLIWYKD